ncbi:hypothetical protein EV378_0031 [Pseudonocardia endophytica]|uniref:Uncharacterized protein n=1 Tax=Pseudonocardia endophytica TaxID=401976 RepID=A0A4R1HUE7_PSEEN|nr:hypothetical protein EV378_0031 [Pseudonocardia endophytica]
MPTDRTPVTNRDGKELSVRFADFLEIGDDGVLRSQWLTVDFAPPFA